VSELATPDLSHVPSSAPHDAPDVAHASPAGAGAGPARRVGLLGGTFDPPHVGHLAVAAGVRWALGLDVVWLVVANEPWQKVGQREISPAADRLAMTRAAVDGVGGLEVSTIEIDRGGSSYTADTVAALRRADPGNALFVIVGADVAGGLPTWERVDEVRLGATMVLVDRPGLAADPPPDGWTFERVEIPRLDVSSHDLRHRVADARPIDGLVPVAVSSLIRERGLYRGPCV